MLNIVYKDIDDLKPYEKNPRKNEDAIEYVANSISDFGFKQPIVVDKNNVIVVGHTRYEAAKKIGLKEVPVVVADELTDEEIKEYRLVDNKTKELADWDAKLLTQEIKEISAFDDIDLNDFGFNVTFDVANDEDDEYDEYEESEEVYVGGNQSSEISLDSFDDENYKYTCPECGFNFNKGL